MSKSRHLAALLDDFQPRTPEQAGFARRMRELNREGEAAFSRVTFVPGHFTASAFILSPDERELLLILHAKLGLWLQPGGHVDAGDADVLAAARREIAEEVGLAEVDLVTPGIFDVDVHDIPALKGDPPHAHFDVRFLFRARDKNAQAASDAEAARWVALEEVAAVQSDASVMRAVRQLLRR